MFRASRNTLLHKQLENDESQGKININISNQDSIGNLCEPSTYLSINDSNDQSVMKHNGRNGAISLPRFTKVTNSLKANTEDKEPYTSKYIQLINTRVIRYDFIGSKEYLTLPTVHSDTKEINESKVYSKITPSRVIFRTRYIAVV